MESKPIIHELFAQANVDFKRHLNLNGNERILFSGKFGVGKTTFIKNFFEKDKQKQNFENKKKYNPIYLYPVNYTVATNEDIFKYVKYDILYELIHNYTIKLEKNDFSLAFTSNFYLWYNLPKIIVALSSYIPKVGKEIEDVYKKISDLQKELIKYNEELNKKESDEIMQFHEKYINVEGSIYEDNSLTKLIETKLEELKDREEVENVLIIDDLDRIDPHHIFRLFNVFAAHFDNKEFSSKKNKFGFDKIIFVCDIENIRNIFKHQYGINTDFSGYIDKFYSKKIFEYNFDNYLIDYFDAVFFHQTRYFFYEKESLHIPFFDRFRSSFRFVLLKFIVHKSINIRKLLKYHSKSILEFLNKPIILDKRNEIVTNNWLNIPVLVLDILIDLFGDRKSLKEALLEIYDIESRYINDNNQLNDYKYELGYLLPLLDWHKNKMSKSPQQYVYYNKGCKLYVEYSREYKYRDYEYADINTVENREINATIGTQIMNAGFIFYLYYDILKILEDAGYYNYEQLKGRH